MASKNNDILQGTLTLLVLKSLSEGKLHGYAIASRIKRASSDALRVEEGSLYPALHRLEQDGFIQSEWGLTETNRKARFYSLTRAGRKHLRDEQESWVKLTEAVASVLRFTEQGA
jgi:PadR family transcriptional regulator, regulatory protein PadR